MHYLLPHLQVKNRGEKTPTSPFLTSIFLSRYKDELRKNDIHLCEPPPGAARFTSGLATRFRIRMHFSGNGHHCAKRAPSAEPKRSGAGAKHQHRFVCDVGSDFDRPGLVPRANYNIGIGHTFGFLKKDPVGDELTFGYTHENAETHGFLHTNFGEHTESLGS
jgi:hypothetical protein